MDRIQGTREMDFRAHTIAELAADVNEGRRTAESLVQAALQNIADHDEALNAFCAVDGARAGFSKRY